MYDKHSTMTQTIMMVWVIMADSHQNKPNILETKNARTC